MRLPSSFANCSRCVLPTSFKESGSAPNRSNSFRQPELVVMNLSGKSHGGIGSILDFADKSM